MLATGDFGLSSHPGASAMTDLDPAFERLQADPDICSGQVCVEGTRIPVSLILDMLAGGDTIEDILDGYPALTREDIAAALAYSAPKRSPETSERRKVYPMTQTSIRVLSMRGTENLGDSSVQRSEAIQLATCCPTSRSPYACGGCLPNRALNNLLEHLRDHTAANLVTRYARLSWDRPGWRDVPGPQRPPARHWTGPAPSGHRCVDRRR